MSTSKESSGVRTCTASRMSAHEALTARARFGGGDTAVAAQQLARVLRSLPCPKMKLDATRLARRQRDVDL